MTRKIEFNNGFVTALSLFYGHRFQFEEASKIVGHDMRIYGATDHLYNIEFPKRLPRRIKKLYGKFHGHCFTVRLENIKIEEGNQIFSECLEVIKAIDRHYFVKNVKVHYE